MAKLGILLCVFLAVGVAEAKKQPKPNIRKQIINAENKIEYLNRKQACRTDGDCTAMPFGFKACGGPKSYLIVSKRNPNFKRLSELVPEHRKLKEEEARRYSYVSACDVAPEPIPRCIDRKCQATLSGRVNFSIVQGLLGLKFDSSMRIQKEEDFKKYWTDWMAEHNDIRQIPVVDFSTQELFAYHYCKTEEDGVYSYRLSQIEDTGPTYIARYTKMKLCPSQLKRPCESDFASLARTDKSVEIRVASHPQACGK